MAIFANRENGKWTVLIDDTLDLGLHDIKRLVPADPLEFGLASVGRVDLIGISAWLPVDSFQRILDAILRIDAVLVSQCEIVRRRFHARLEHLIAHLDLPKRRLQLLFCVGVKIVDRADTNDSSVL